MNKIQLTFVILVLSSLSAKAQNFSKEFKKVGKDEIELTQYAPDKNAEAVVLFDFGKSFFIRSDNSFEVIFERTTRVKILAESGIKWAQVEIPYYQEGDVKEKVYDIEAYTHNFENGQLMITHFNVAETYDEKLNNSWNLKKFAVPNAKEGSIVEYKYKISSQYLFNLRDWEFQWRIPVVYSEYEVKIIPFYEYSWLLQGASRFDTQTSNVEDGLEHQFGGVSYKNMVHKYIMKNMPAFSSEEFLTSISDYIVKLDFQLARINYPNGVKVDILTTWEEMIKELLKHEDFGKYIKKSSKLAPKLLEAESSGLKTEREKFDFVLDYVKRNYNWNTYKGKYASKSPNKLLAEKNGNSADINLFTIGLLNAMGIDAKPVIISTRDHGKVKFNYPYAHFFNYVIILATVDGETFLSDATEILGQNNRIPSRCINDKGLVISEGKVDWIGLECMFPSQIETVINIDEPVNGAAQAGISIAATEYDALYYRNNYTDKVETVKKLIETNNKSIIENSIVVENQLHVDKPYILSYKQTVEPLIVNEKMYVSPFLNEVIADNPLKQKERTYPIDMTYPKKRVFVSTIDIPAGYQIESLPMEQTIKDQLFILSYNAIAEEGKIKVSFEYSFTKAVYSATDFSKIRFYFNEIVKKGNEKIVFSKKSTEVN
jgi:hypothetical protein